MPERNTWWDDMACKNVDPQIFDEKILRGGRPPKNLEAGQPWRQQDWSRAASICGRCTVRNDCLEYVMSMPVETFVGPGTRTFAAGYTPDQLDQIRRRRRTRRAS